MNSLLWFVAGVLTGPALTTLFQVALKIFVNAWKASRK